MSNLTTRPKSLFGVARQIAPSSPSDRTRSRDLAPQDSFVPVTGLASHKPSPIDHATNIERQLRAWSAVIAPLSSAIVPRREATVARVMLPSCSLLKRDHVCLRYR